MSPLQVCSLICQTRAFVLEDFEGEVALQHPLRPRVRHPLSKPQLPHLESKGQNSACLLGGDEDEDSQVSILHGAQLIMSQVLLSSAALFMMTLVTLCLSDS